MPSPPGFITCRRIRCVLTVALATWSVAPLACAQASRPATQPARAPDTQIASNDTEGKAREEDTRVYETILIGKESFKLEVAADNESRGRGLMGRTSIPEFGGMLFVFDVPNQQFFWMKNCLINIDVIFLDQFGRITAMHKMKKPRPRGLRESQASYERRLESYSSVRPAQFAIELKAGTLDRLKLKRNDVIHVPKSLINNGQDRKPDYLEELRRHMLNSQPPGRNAWPLLKEAANKIHEIQKTHFEDPESYWNEDTFGFSLARNGALSGDEAEQIQLGLKLFREHGVDDLIAQAMQRPTCCYTFNFNSQSTELLYGMALPELQPLRQYFDAQVAVIHVAVRDDPNADIIPFLHRAVYISQSLMSQAMIVQHIVGCGMVGQMCETLTRIVNQRQLNDEQLVALRDALPDPAALPSAVPALEGERIVMYDNILYFFTTGGIVGEKLNLTRLAETGVDFDNWKRQLMWKGMDESSVAGRRESIDKVNEFFDYHVAEAQLPHHVNGRPGYPTINWYITEGLRFPVLKMMMPAFSRGTRARDAAQTQLHGLQLSIAIERYRLAYGELPTALSDLSPDFIDVVPPDPYSGREFSYVVLESPVDGVDYVLYSTGVNGTDDGGIYPDGNPFYALTRGDKEDDPDWDAVLNVPRTKEE